MTPLEPTSETLRLTDLKSRIDADAYVVDPHLVAHALLLRAGPGLGLPLNPGDARSPRGPADPTRREG